jgi:parallel beta-helix repeat protein/predicted outer membrane repeat protein
MNALIGFGLLLVAAHSGMASVIHVPSDFVTIQAAINSTIDGDTVLVADGTYTGSGNRDIDFGGKAICVVSENGAAVTTIDCQADSLDPHRGFYFHNGEDSTSILSGFTITNGWQANNGGGVSCEYSSPTIVNNVITGNIAQTDGGGIYLLSSSPLIEGNTITGNIAVAYYGGGILCRYYSSPVIRGNVITDNMAGCGGGVAAWAYYSSPVIELNIITDNEAQYGGGIYSSDAYPTLERNLICGNTAYDYGGAIYCTNYSYMAIEGNTITANTADDGGGIYGVGYSYPWVHNSIVYGDTAVTGNEIKLDFTSTAQVSFSDIEGGWSGQGNIDGDPLFLDPPGGDYGLSTNSPCVDAGDPTSGVPGRGACVVDMGAFELWQGIICHKEPVPDLLH